MSRSCQILAIGDQIRDLLDVFGIAHAVMTQGVAEAPEFLYDVYHGMVNPFIFCQFVLIVWSFRFLF